MPELAEAYTIPVLLSFRDTAKNAEKQLGGALDGKKFGKKFGTDIASGVKASEADVKRAMDGYAKLYDKQADAAGKLRVELKKLDDAQKSGNQTRILAQTERAEKAKRDEARAVRDARDAYKDYEDAAKRAANAADDVGGGLLDKLKGLGSSASGAGGEAASGFVEGFGGPIAALGTKAGPIGIALAAAAALGVGAGSLIAKQVMAGVEQQQQQADVAAKLGLSPEQMKPIAAASADAYASNFGESVAANMDTARAAIQSGLLDPNATQADVEKMVAQLSTVSAVMGEDIPQTARAAQQAIRTGLVGNATEAFDLFTKAQQSGLNVSEDFLDTINEYGTQFRKLGLDGPEAIGLISQAVKGGARDSDVAADAIKEFSIRAIDGSKSTAEAFSDIGLNAEEMAAKLAQGGPTAKAAFDEVLDAVRSIDDPIVQSRVAVGLFGTQAEDLGAALNSMDLTNAVDQLGQVDGAAQQAADTMGNTTAASVESAKRSIETAADSMQQSLAEAFGPTLQQGAAWITEHQDDIKAAFQWMAGGATEFGAAVVGVTGGVVSGFGYLVSALGDTVGFVLDGFEQMTGAAATVAGALGLDGLEGDLRGAQQQLGVWSDQFHGWGEGLVNLGDNITNAGLKLHDLDLNAAAAGDSTGIAAQRAQELATVLGGLPGSKKIDISAVVIYKDTAGVVIPPDQLRAPTVAPAIPGETRRPAGGRAGGGSILGPGGPKSDIIPIWASNGEHMLSARDVNAMGGQAGVYRFRSALHRAEGGAIEEGIRLASSLDGLPYIYGSRDCSKVQSDVYAALTGKPTSARYFTTESDFESLGFVKGYMPGAYNIGVRRGGGGKLSHMAGTLPNGVRFEAGGATSTVKYGGEARGAEDFPLQWYLPVTGGDPASAATASGTPQTASGGGTSGGSSGGGGGGGIGSIPGLTGGGAGGGSGGGLGGLGEIGSIFGSALKETFGFDGSFFPDIANLMPVQFASNLLNAFKGPIQGALEGKLGIQQPGWTPEMGEAGITALQGTSNAPFGMPDVAPPMPPGSQHAGTGGLPGPAPMTVNVDQSQQFNNSQLGWDPVEVNRVRDANQQRRALPRLSGMGQGT